MNRFETSDNNRFFGPGAAEEFLMVCTQAGRVIYQSASLRHYLEEDLTGRNLNDFIADRLAASVIARAQQNHTFTFETVVLERLFTCKSEPGGENIHLYFEPLSDRDSVFINSTSAIFISREIRTALSMMMAADQLLAGEDLSPAGRTGAAVMRQNIHRLLRLSLNMLDCALASGDKMRLNFSQTDVCALCRELGERLSGIMDGMNIRFTLELDPEPVICQLDREKVERMLYNLISNSIIALDSRREIVLSATQRDASAVITVTDRGRGIEDGLFPHAMRKHSAFDPEAASGFSGAGFGVALVEALAKRHGGSFVITTKPSQGTLARITLPLRQKGEAAPLKSPPFSYLGGMDRALVELSTALDKEFYLK